MSTRLKNKLLLILAFVTLLAVSPISSIALQKSEPIEIELNVLPGLQFNLARFHVHPGQKVKLTFTNTDDMDHNLIITKPGKREDIVKKAAAMGAAGIKNNYVPDDIDILWSTPILHDGQSKTVTFIAPEKEGVYPYVCTLPGHGYIMYGAMYVNKSGDMPPIEKDRNIPPTRTTADSPHTHHHSPHPYTPKPPYLYRVYMEGVGPAAIAVHLPGKTSYCWDAGSCMFRFAWTGDFVDNTLLWKGHKDARSAILGHIFYTEKQSPILRIGNSSGSRSHQFKGYKILKDGYPEFRYLLDGTEVFELITERKGGDGIARRFRIPQSKDSVRLYYTETEGVQHYFNGTRLSGGILHLSATEAKEFTIETHITN